MGQMVLSALLALLFFVGIGGGAPKTAARVLAGETAASAGQESVAVTVNGSPYRGAVDVQEGTAFVHLGQMGSALWDGAVLTAEDGVFTLSADGGSALTAVAGRLYLERCGRCFWCGDELEATADGADLWVPVRPLAAALGATVLWRAETETAAVTAGDTAIETAETYYDSRDLFWLSRIIEAEAGGEILAGKVAVGNVVLNRVASDEFPNTVYGVIFDIRFGVQFSPVASGSVYRSPSAASVTAAKLALEGAVIDGEMLYFMNPRRSSSTWMRDNCRFVMSVGNHDFYA